MRLIALLFVLLFAAPAWADDPVLFFSDLTGGPKSGWEGSSTKGAAVTVWGLNLGTTRGTSSMTVCGETLNSAGDFAEWGANTTPTAARGLQRITFYLNSSMDDGEGTISATVDGVESNTLQFWIRAGDIFFVNKGDVNASDSNDGSTKDYVSGTTGPWQYLKNANTHVNSNVGYGDIVYIAEGTYDTANDQWSAPFCFDGGSDNWVASTAYTTDTWVFPNPANKTNMFYEATTGGTSGGTEPSWPTTAGQTVVDGTVTWTCRAARQKYGREIAGVPYEIGIIAYPGEDVEIGHGTVRGFRTRDDHGPVEWMVLSKFKFNSEAINIYFHGIDSRIVGCEFDPDMPSARVSSGIVNLFGCNNVHFLGNYFEGAGYDDYQHELYINSALQGAGYAIGSWTSHHVYVQYCEFYNSQPIDHAGGTGGPVIYIKTQSSDSELDTEDIYISHNLFNNSNYGAPFWIQRRVHSFYFWNNIAYNMATETGGRNQQPDYWQATPSGAEYWVVNNTWYNCGYGSEDTHRMIRNDTAGELNSHNNIYSIPSSLSYVHRESGSTMTVDSNSDLYYGAGAISGETWLTLTAAQNNVDPLFTNPATGDFTLQLSSPAIGSGSENATVISLATDDYYGRARNTSDMDIGAVVYSAAQSGNTTIGVGVLVQTDAGVTVSIQ